MQAENIVMHCVKIMDSTSYHRSALSNLLAITNCNLYEKIVSKIFSRKFDNFLNPTHDFKEQGMLILTRRVGETLIIGGNVTVTVLGVKGNQTRIGINAPDEVSIHRKEIYKRIQLENQAKLNEQKTQ